jgi:NAD+ synthase (glutamine-hydrolysing)
MRMTSFQDSVADHHSRLAALRSVPFDFEAPRGEVALERRVERFPYVPTDRARRDERCDEVYRIQVQGLAQRLEATGIERVVIGVSGGLDSTHALLIAAKTFDLLGRPRRDVMAWTLPGLATSGRTLANARELMRCLGVTAGEIDISEAALAMLRRIGHPYAKGEPVYDVTFENVQAGSAPRTCSGSPISIAAWSWAPATSRSWLSVGAPMASATRCRTTTSTLRFPRL